MEQDRDFLNREYSVYLARKASINDYFALRLITIMGKRYLRFDYTPPLSLITKVWHPASSKDLACTVRSGPSTAVSKRFIYHPYLRYTLVRR